MTVRRKHILNNPRLQTRFAAIISSVTLAVSLVLGSLVFQSTIASNQLARELSANAFAKEELASLARKNRNLILFIVYFAVFAALGSSLLAITMTHRIVGPLMRIEKRFKEMESGNLGAPIRIRRKDAVRPLADVLERHRSQLIRLIKTIQSLSEKLQSISTQCAGKDAVRCQELADALQGDIRKFTWED